MDALRFYGVRDIRFEEAPEPIIETDSEVKIKVKAVGICGSDIFFINNVNCSSVTILVTLDISFIISLISIIIKIPLYFIFYL